MDDALKRPRGRRRLGRVSQPFTAPVCGLTTTRSQERLKNRATFDLFHAIVAGSAVVQSASPSRPHLCRRYEAIGHGIRSFLFSSAVVRPCVREFIVRCRCPYLPPAQRLSEFRPQTASPGCQRPLTFERLISDRDSTQAEVDGSPDRLGWLEPLRRGDSMRSLFVAPPTEEGRPQRYAALPS